MSKKNELVDNPSESKHLDEINRKRVVSSAKRVAAAISAVKQFSANDEFLVKRLDGDSWDVAGCQKSLAKAIRLVSTAREDMSYACRHFDWDDMVCYDLESAIEDLGCALAETYGRQSLDAVSSGVSNALTKAALVLGSLTEWFEDDETFIDEFDN